MSAIHEFRQALLLGLYALPAYIVFQLGNEITPTLTEDIFDDPIRVFWTAAAVLFATLGYLLYWYSSTHLFAQYAIKISIAPEPRKRKNDLD